MSNLGNAIHRGKPPSIHPMAAWASGIGSTKSVWCVVVEQHFEWLMDTDWGVPFPKEFLDGLSAFILRIISAEAAK